MQWSPAMTYEREAIARMSGYTPGEQPARTVVAKLNTNENPYPPCAAVMKALHGINGHALSSYPSAMADGSRAQAAALNGLPPATETTTTAGAEVTATTNTRHPQPDSTATYSRN